MTEKTSLETILTMEGIAIRLIPRITISRYAHREGRELAADETLIDSNGRKMVERTKANSLGGKYLVTFARNQDSQVRYALSQDGIGDTIEDAYQDYRAKR